MKMTGNLTASLSATELTEDHSSGGDDERARIEEAGGIVVTLWGRPCINAELPMSRAIGDVYQKQFQECFSRLFLKKHKLHNLIKRKFYILTMITTTIKKHTNI